MRLGLASHEVRIVEYDPRWSDDYGLEAERLLATIPQIRSMHHVGSTAIEGMPAKPILDMLAVVDDLNVYLQIADRLAGAGYPLLPERINIDRVSFPRGPAACQTHHLTLVEDGSYRFHRIVAVRDYLRRHGHESQAYANLKRKLAVLHAGDRYAYSEGKKAFVEDLVARAMRWAR